METVVLYPSPGMGHLVSMVELGKLLLYHHPSLSVTILTTPFPFGTTAVSTFVSGITSAAPSITLHSLLAISLPREPCYVIMTQITFDILRLNDSNVLDALVSLSSNISSFMLICSALLLSPTYMFYTSSASYLLMSLCLPFIDRTTKESFKDLHGVYVVDIPGLPPIPAASVPETMQDRDSKSYQFVLESAEIRPTADGIIINTFDELEHKALVVLTSGVPVSYIPSPPIYCIGPLIASGAGGNDVPRHECLVWLDSQPSHSVVFLCFGSLGLFTSEQLKEIATGLEKSGHRFLWVVRVPATEDKAKRFLPPEDPDLDHLLPPGFLDRTNARGHVLKSHGHPKWPC